MRDAHDKPGRSPRPASTAMAGTGRARARRGTLRRVGARVRALRDARDMPRRALADASGVSARFLAELESGVGNISVARLSDVAHALGTTAAALLSPHDVGAQDPMLRAIVDQLVDRLGDEELAALRRWLTTPAARSRAAGSRVIALLGVRGAGKSTVGRRLAKRLAVPFVELDALIEEAAGLTLAEIFELHGEAYYRRVERETLARFLDEHPAAVLATGGSLVSDPESYALLRRRAVTVWLKARPEDHWNRVLGQGDQRPMAQSPHAMQELEALLEARARLYAAADFTVDTSGLGAREVEARVAALLPTPRRRAASTTGAASAT